MRSTSIERLFKRLGDEKEKKHGLCRTEDALDTIMELSFERNEIMLRLNDHEVT